jgi:thiol-disulfide isomerase/thioredoxin
MNLLSKLLLILILVGFTYYYFKYIRKPNLELNEIEIVSLDRDFIDIKQYVGKPLIVNFWATWCGPCIKELPNFEKINRKYGGDVVFLLISEENPAKILPYKNSFDFDFVLSSKSFEDYGVNTWPTSYFYDKNGQLIDKHNGSLTLEDLGQYVDKIMPSSSIN